MVGISLTPEQIRSAPAEVRWWLEREIAISLGFPTAPEPATVAPNHLVACSAEEASAVYAAIRGMLPVVNVFFELGREGQSLNQNKIKAYLLADMVRHTRLTDFEKIAECLQVIDGALRQMRGDAPATICAYDGRGCCLIATETQRNIANMWKQLLAGLDLDDSAPVEANGISLQGARPFPRFPEKQLTPVRRDPAEALSAGAGVEPLEAASASNALL
jgi:hypothetical protein